MWCFVPQSFCESRVADCETDHLARNKRLSSMIAKGPDGCSAPAAVSDALCSPLTMARETSGTCLVRKHGIPEGATELWQ